MARSGITSPRDVVALLLRRHGMLLALAGATLLGQRFFFGGLARVAQWPVATVLTVLVASLLLRLLLGPHLGRQRSPASPVDRVELGMLVLVSVYVVVQLSGGNQASPLHPLVYVIVAVLVGANPRAVGIALTGVALGLEAVSTAALIPGGWLAALPPIIPHAAFILIFATASFIFLRVEVVRRRRQHEEALAEEIRRMQQEAREFRLVQSALSSEDKRGRDLDESRLTRAAVLSIHQNMFFLLDVLKQTLRLQTCVLLWLDSRGRSLRIKELVTDSHAVTETPVPAHAGPLGGIVANRLLVNLRRPNEGCALSYYAAPEQVGAFLGVPVLEDGHLRGVLCGDRRDELPFSEEEERLFGEVTGQILRAIQTERSFCAVERSKYEYERFYQGSRLLNGALTLSQVYETAFAAVREIVDFDQGALTLYDPLRRRHTICKVTGAADTALEGESFAPNAGLVAMVVKNKHFLPAVSSGKSRGNDRDAVVFSATCRLKQVESLVVLPLIVQDRAMGTLVLASRKGDHFTRQTTQMLSVICNQVAIAIENAKMYKRMEELATTDGLTGLPNHRTFQGRFSEMLYRAERYQKPVAMVLTDVDRFKSVNDTYGHPVGDAVLRRVANVLAEQARKIDLVARYGGEEFAMILEETDGEEARLVCERVRQEVAKQVVSTDRGPLSVTLSLGIACYPEDGREKELLIERADQALYLAKETGRNRTVRFGDFAARPAAQAAGQ